MTSPRIALLTGPDGPVYVQFIEIGPWDESGTRHMAYRTGKSLADLMFLHGPPVTGNFMCGRVSGVNGAQPHWRLVCPCMFNHTQTIRTPMPWGSTN